ncbi:MAG TPA: biopolymer transporter ExbD [Bacteroidia bacterium]|jgi:biopolymer transport protein ExbD|nr:biopolymer transporter ExbD [Bacteroidia bacterium]
MPKIKMPRANPSLDMTPMVDLAFLLVTFFMLTASVRVSEPVVIDSPSSTADKLLPDNVIMVTVDNKGKAYFNINNAEVRIKTLEKMGQQYKITFTDQEKKRFGGMTSFGVPMATLKKYIDMEDPERIKSKSPGIPLDSLHNELGDWINFGRIEAARQAKTQKDKAESLGRTFKYEPLRFAIKADGQANYIAVKDVIKVFTDRDIYRFNLITNLEDGGAEKK